MAFYFIGLIALLGVIDPNDGITVFVWLMAGITLPINIYAINAFTRYKRRVEYGTSEWHRLKKKRKGTK